MHCLCTELPTTILCQSAPRCCIICHATWVFSLPWSQLTCDGSPYWRAASKKASYTVPVIFGTLEEHNHSAVTINSYMSNKSPPNQFMVTVCKNIYVITAWMHTYTITNYYTYLFATKSLAMQQNMNDEELNHLSIAIQYAMDLLLISLFEWHGIQLLTFFPTPLLLQELVTENASP